MKTLVIGCGAWGTTLADLIGNKNKVTLYCHDQKIIPEINTKKTNALYLPTFKKLSKNITAIGEESLVTETLNADLIVIVVAAKFFRRILKLIKPHLNKQLVLSATKGVEIESGLSVLDICQEELSSQVYYNQLAFLSGPNLAKEIYLGKPAATIIATKNTKVAKTLQKFISCPALRVYTSSDVIGVEYGGILKNIIAIAGGACDALDLGYNSKSALLVRSLAEIKRFAVKLGAQEKTFNGLSGMGDLMATCFSPDSRNYQVGFNLGKGQSLEDIIDNMSGVAEGVTSTKVIYKKAQKLNIPVPIIESIFQILYQKKSIPKVIQKLMTRNLKDED